MGMLLPKADVDLLLPSKGAIGSFGRGKPPPLQSFNMNLRYRFATAGRVTRPLQAVVFSYIM